METQSNKYKYGVRSTFAQCLAICGPCFVQIVMGSLIMSTTIIIGALDNSTSVKDPNEPLSITVEQASWYGSLPYLCTPLGSVLSSLLLDRLGHKNCLILANVPCLAVQLLLYLAGDVATLYACSVIIGLVVGFTNAPCLEYAGDVCEPKLRGSLISAINVCVYAGSAALSVAYGLDGHWRPSVLMTAALPVLAAAIVYTTPDSPVWLIVKGDNAKAHRNLARLRGKVSRDTCVAEFQEMVVYCNATDSSADDHGGDNNVNDAATWRQLTEPEVIRPFCLIVWYFFFTNLMSGIPFSPYLVTVFTEFNVPVAVEWTITLSMAMSVIGGVMTIFLVHKLGKRPITLYTLSLCSVGYVIIGLIGWTDPQPAAARWTLLIIYLFTLLMSSFGITPLGWILLAEIFPVKSRNITVSTCAALFYIIGFFMTKYYPNLSDLMGFYTVFIVFGVAGLFGCVYFYFRLPETENKTLQEISEFFK